METARSVLLSKILQKPKDYVFAVEARTEFDGDMVTHIASSLEKARAYCLAYPTSDMICETRLHIIPHLIDAPDNDYDSGITSIAIYGLDETTNTVCELTQKDEQ